MWNIRYQGAFGPSFVFMFSFPLEVVQETAQILEYRGGIACEVVWVEV